MDVAAPLFLQVWKSRLTFILPKYIAMCPSQVSSHVKGTAASIIEEQVKFERLTEKQ